MQTRARTVRPVIFSAITFLLIGLAATLYPASVQAQNQCPTGPSTPIVTAKNVTLQPGVPYSLADILCFTPPTLAQGQQLYWVAAGVTGFGQVSLFGTCAQAYAGVTCGPPPVPINVPEDIFFLSLEVRVAIQWTESCGTGS